MATVDDINTQKNAAVALLDQKIYDAIAQKNQGGLTSIQANQLDQAIHDMMVQRQAVYLQAYNAALGSDQMASALTALTAATTEMNSVASQMTTATTTIANVTAFLTAAGKITAVLKG